MVKFLILLAWLVVSCTAGWAERWPEVLPGLRHGRLARAQLLQSALREELPLQSWEGSTEPWLLTLNDGTRLVFRCQDEKESALAELGGYRVSRWLNLDLVPPTVPRLIDREEWPESTPWPFAQPERLGTCQLMVPSHNFTPEEYARVEVQRKAEIEILCFLLGRYDNHLGNVLACDDGLPALIDFDSTTQEQHARYGEFAYVVNGRWRKDLPTLEANQPFPFDSPSLLVEPTKEQILATFGAWSIWPGTVPILLNSARSGDRTIRYALWNHRLWIQCRAGSRHPCFTDTYPTALMERLEQLSLENLRSLLPPVYQDQHLQAILERRDQLLRAYRSR